jgi:hypothetical protein
MLENAPAFAASASAADRAADAVFYGGPGTSQCPVPLSSSLILFAASDMAYVYRQNGRQSSWCAQVGNAARAAGSTSINLVMTQKWQPVQIGTVDKEKRPVYDHFAISYFCYLDVGGGPCLPFTSAAVDTFRDKLTSCIGTLIDIGCAFWILFCSVWFGLVWFVVSCLLVLVVESADAPHSPRATQSTIKNNPRFKTIMVTPHIDNAIDTNQ